MHRRDRDHMNHPVRCRCGTVQGHVVPSSGATHAICYCRDCQAYARFIGTEQVADENGGTVVVASLPRHVALTAGLDSLACVSLSPRGLLRWYARCCDTPIANTPRNPKVPYVGVVHNCLETGGRSIEQTFGPLRAVANAASARKPVASRSIATGVAVLGLVSRAIVDRLGGAYKRNPFFLTGTRTPIRTVRVLSQAERERVYRIGE
jgi:hypothetical protein